MSKLPSFEYFLCVGNLKPKLKWFFKPKPKPKMFLCNWVPDAGVGGREPEGAVGARVDVVVQVEQ